MWRFAVLCCFCVIGTLGQKWTPVSREIPGDDTKQQDFDYQDGDKDPTHIPGDSYPDLDSGSQLYKKLREQTGKFVPHDKDSMKYFNDRSAGRFDEYPDEYYDRIRSGDYDGVPGRGKYPRYNPVNHFDDYQYDSRGGFDMPDNNYHKYAPCSNIPGGLTRLATGVDITQLELFNSVSTESGLKGPIFDYSCDEGKLWTNAYNTKTYQIPDQVWKIEDVPGDSINKQPTVFKSYEEIKQYLFDMVGLSKLNGAFSLSKGFQDMTKDVELDSKMIVDILSHFFNTEVMLEPYHTIQLGFHVESFLSTLADDYEDEPEGYDEFIRTFGTHYFSSATIGPSMRNLYFVESDYHVQHTESSIIEESMRWFNYWFETVGHKKTSKIVVDKNFQSKTKVEVEIYGGQSEVFTDSGVHEWIETAIDVPQILKGKLVPIYNLIDDPKIKESMQRAVQVHLDRAFLAEIKMGLEITEKKYQKGKIDNLLKIDTEIGTMVKSNVVDHDLITKWGDIIESSLAVPKWWQQTFLCYQFTNDVANKYCSGSTPTCAPVNQFTDLYQDWSRKAGGCHMSWGLFSRAAVDDWFKDVRLCFKFASNGDIKQCGNGTAKEICTKLNNYSPVYYDHTDHRKGGCEMQWKISIKNPELVPSWFANTKLCYNFKVNVKGKPFPKELTTKCAFVNEYTPVYLDDTTFRNYGHYTENFIQWGITDVLA